MSDRMIAETISIVGHAGTEIEAYFARPARWSPCPSVVVIHHMPGYDVATKEITRTFAEHGYAALTPNLHHRWAPGDPVGAAAAARAAGGVPDDQLLGDINGALRVLRSRLESNTRVGVVGYCSGGRQAWVAATTLDIDAVVDCYGARADLSLARHLRCPFLGLFGEDDENPGPAEVDALETALRDNGQTFEICRLRDAGHAFFAVDRPTYRVDAATEGWARIWQFLGLHLTRA
jgi:carboxymethylenebutenolidase